MKIRLMHRGDRILSVSPEFIAVQRKNGEVDIIPLMMDGSGIRVDQEHIVTIGYGNNEVETSINGVSIVNF